MPGPTWVLIDAAGDPAGWGEVRTDLPSAVAAGMTIKQIVRPNGPAVWDPATGTLVAAVPLGAAAAAAAAAAADRQRVARTALALLPAPAAPAATVAALLARVRVLEDTVRALAAVALAA